MMAYALCHSFLKNATHFFYYINTIKQVKRKDIE